MKTTFFLFCGLLYLQTNAQYYYGKDTTINVSIDSSKVIIIFNTGYEQYIESNAFSQDSNIIDLSNANEDSKNALRIWYNIKITDIAQKVISYEIPAAAVKEYSYGYTITNFPETEYWPLNEVAVKFNTSSTDSAVIQYGLVFDYDDYGIRYYKAVNINSAISIANALVEDGIVMWACPNAYSIIKTTSDPLYTNQYYLHNTGQTIQGNVMPIDYDIDAEEAWTITTGSANIKVAVIDDGVENHEDLDDASGNSRVLCGYSPVLIGANCGRPKNYQSDYNTAVGFPFMNSHGQACAGIIAASHNSLGVRGICPECKIVPIKIFDKKGNIFSNADIAKCINKAWQPTALVGGGYGCDVLSNSWGGGMYSQQIVDAIANARANGRGGKGSVVVFSASNNAGAVNFPASYSGSIAVSAAASLTNLATYSSRGSNIMLAAPSANYVNLFSSTLPNIQSNGITTIDRMGANGVNSGNYSGIFRGTSAAAPQVAGAAALLLSVDPDLTENQVRCRLAVSAKDAGAPGFDNDFGYGLLNIYNAIQLNSMQFIDDINGVEKHDALSINIDNATSITINGNAEFKANQTITINNEFTTGPGTYLLLENTNVGTCGTVGGGAFRTVNNNGNSTTDVLNTYAFAKSTNNTNMPFYVSIYPNPSSTAFNINTNTDGIKEINVFNAQGQKVFENKFSGANYELILNQAGVYTALIKGEGYVKRFKIVKI